MRMMNAEMIKAYGAGEEQKKDDKGISEALKNDSIIDQQGDGKSC